MRSVKDITEDVAAREDDAKTVIVAERAISVADPEHVSVYVVVVVGATGAVPVADLSPDQPLDAVHVDTFSAVQESVDEAPSRTKAGFAVNTSDIRGGIVTGGQSARKPTPASQPPRGVSGGIIPPPPIIIGIIGNIGGIPPPIIIGGIIIPDGIMPPGGIVWRGRQFPSILFGHELTCFGPPSQQL
jgi:hypothetical protein